MTVYYEWEMTRNQKDLVLLTLPLIPLNFSTTVISIYSPVTTTYFYFHGYGDIVNDIEDLPSHKSTLSQYIVIFYKFFEPLGAESSFNCYGTPLAESPSQETNWNRPIIAELPLPVLIYDDGWSFNEMPFSKVVEEIDFGVKVATLKETFSYLDTKWFKWWQIRSQSYLEQIASTLYNNICSWQHPNVTLYHFQEKQILNIK